MDIIKQTHKPVITKRLSENIGLVSEGCLCLICQQSICFIAQQRVAEADDPLNREVMTSWLTWSGVRDVARRCWLGLPLGPRDKRPTRPSLHMCLDKDHC